MSDWRVLEKKIRDAERKEKEHLDNALLYHKLAQRYTDLLAFEKEQKKVKR